MIIKSDKQILHELAKEVAEIAALPIQKKKVRCGKNLMGLKRLNL